MPFSRGDFDDAIMQWAASAVAHTQRILDLGCGSGKYGHLLHRMKPEIDGVELNADFPARFGLDRWYRRVVIADIATWPIPRGQYDLVIIGDVLEHLAVESAQALIKRATDAVPLALVVVPFLSAESGDKTPGGRHLQADLTPEVMAARYPSLRLWLCNPVIGVYFAGDRAESMLRGLR
jgi:2-polyprenyl-3-methyl-5-hydroxy-6-metoxy-1,4-benzoquinol methylase